MFGKQISAPRRESAMGKLNAPALAIYSAATEVVDRTADQRPRTILRSFPTRAEISLSAP
ncbi:hypothetical protein RE9431_21950 [Prescottella equi]|nr:hypothetical protein RE9414_22120 [Prescottella equi]BCN48883.1 hypothetical protein RE9416_21840 [Prescottella equi]BCN53905.1 hypothetical protein RE9425_22950 [Prescottella equi]BCN58857.1 hypothetical protein RE9427_22270 [Prescottella equi]BCN63740.1 hypothetical protein RE9431_21950 [Prescottella equi]